MKPYQIARPLGLGFLYSAALVFSLWSAYLLRFDFNPGDYLRRFDLIAAGVVGLKLMLLIAFQQFGSLLSYFSLPDIRKIFLAMLAAALVQLAMWMWQGIAVAPPRAVILTDFILSFLAICMLRTGFRLLREGYFEKASGTGGRRVAVIGAGDIGAALVKEFAQRASLGIRPIAFFDDDRRKWRKLIHGIPVRGGIDLIGEFIRHNPLDEAIIAMPNASGQRLREVLQILSAAGIRAETVPSLEQLVTGKVKVSQIRPVEIEDLLGRETVNLQTDRIRDLVHDRVILVTGAGGSIGSELCRQIATHAPRRLLLVERSEYLLFQIEQELARTLPQIQICPFVADILDEGRIRSILTTHLPTVLFHAAAHKHVPMMELQPGEAFRNNVLGSRLLARLSVECRVQRFVFISTDKAINPTSVMGATKRVAELYLQGLQAMDSSATRFMAVRFGNVLGSSGSVIPTFKRQIAAGGPVTVTHPEVTRYFMTVSEAAGLVIQSAALGEGGEIFVLDMGQPIKIADLARQLIELSGLKPGIDIQIKYTGLRPGEKLYEELNHDTEAHSPTSHPKIMRFMGQPPRLPPLEAAILTVSPGGGHAEIRSALKALVPEYTPGPDPTQPRGLPSAGPLATSL